MAQLVVTAGPGRKLGPADGPNRASGMRAPEAAVAAPRNGLPASRPSAASSSSSSDTGIQAAACSTKLATHSPVICLVATFKRLKALIAAIATTSAISWDSL
jgi:hypothetical protein